MCSGLKEEMKFLKRLRFGCEYNGFPEMYDVITTFYKK